MILSTTVCLGDGDGDMVLDVTSSGLQILDIGVGEVQKYNLTQPMGQQVKEGDIIVKINACTKPLDMLSVLANEKRLAMQVARPEMVNITVDKANQVLGLGLRYTAGSRCMEVTEISDGAIQEYNDRVERKLRVLPSDLIWGVNGVSTTIGEMLHELRSSQRVCLSLLRVTTQEIRQGDVEEVDFSGEDFGDNDSVASI